MVAFCSHEHSAHVGMMDDRFGRPRAGLEVAPLHALLGVFERALIGAVGKGDALHADRKSCGIHHDEHVLEAAIRLADEIADGAVALFAVVQRAGRIGVDAELVLDARADDVVALAERFRRH